MTSGIITPKICGTNHIVEKITNVPTTVTENINIMLIQLIEDKLNMVNFSSLLSLLTHFLGQLTFCIS